MMERSKPKASATTNRETYPSSLLIDIEASNNDKDKDNNDDHHEHKVSYYFSTFLVLFFRYILQIVNIGLWYWTNGMNGIAMQSYAGGMVIETALQSDWQRFLSIWTITCIITSLQLLMGAALGRAILYGLLDKTLTWKQITSTNSWTLSGLHALGSMATNLGFMYGKASLIQVIKLLEPFETLMLSQLLFRQEGNCTIGIVSSMILLVGAAMSLLKLQSTPPPPPAIFFAILSGLVISSRNVLQRKHLSGTSTGSTGKDNSTTSTTSQQSTKKPAAATSSSAQKSKLTKSVIQFTNLSWYSGIWMSGVSMVSLVLTQPQHLLQPDSQVLLWHPLYNAFSMITLGFCLALTHSLLNAGKRVVAICMALLWFADDEGLNAKTVAGLLLVGIGGAWYSWESKQQQKQISNTQNVMKLVLALVALHSLLVFQQGGGP
jgi:xanthosine utilization system XapX-like protein